MKINVVAKVVVILGFFSLFSACGDLATLLPSNGSYQVRTLVNGSSLENCSIIRSDDKIRPYFAVSVADDPDLIGLLVYFENSQGEVIGEKIQYILQSYAKEVKPAETETNEESEPEKTDDKTSEETETITGKEEIAEEEKLTEEITHKTEEAKEEENERKKQKAGELPEQGAVKEKWSFIDTKPVVKNTEVEIAVKSLSGELPYLPLPKTLEIGSYVMVFEAIGVKETLSRTETNIFYLGSAEFYLKDILMYLPGQSGSQLISPGTTVMLEARLDFDSRLDPYVIWYNGKNIISQGKISSGAGIILWKTPEQAGFYSLRIEAFPFQLKRNNYTGVSREITLPISPKAVDIGYFFENNRKYTARSPLAEGTAYPEQVRLITAMISATKESDDLSEKTEKGKIKTEKSMTVLPPVVPPALPTPPELLQWYQFEGNLHNSTSSLIDTQSLSPIAKKAPRWAAAGQSYGLSTGLDDAYSLPPIKFFRKENDQGGGIFLLHIMPAVEGVVFSAFFPLQSSATDGVWMGMVRKENKITLHLIAEGAIVEIPAYLTFLEPPDLIPIVVEFYIRPYRLEAKLSLSEEYSLENKVGSIKLPGALSGEAKIKLGGGIDKSMTDKSTIDKSTVDKSKTEASPKVQPPVQLTPNLTETLFEETLAAITTNSVEKDANTAAVSETPSLTVNQNTIWDEFAILFSTVPLLQEEFQAELADEKQDAGTESAKPKSESYIPIVEARAAAEYKSEAKSDYKSADNKSAIDTKTTITGSLTSLDSTPLKEGIKMSDIDETETRTTEGDENLIFPAADIENQTQEMPPPPPPPLIPQSENKFITSN